MLKLRPGKLLRDKLLPLIVASLFSLPLSAAPVSTTHNGLTLMGAHVIGDGAEPADRTVLLLHGTLAHHGMEIMQNLQAILAERGINSLAISLSFGLDKRTGMYDCSVPHRHQHEDALDELGVWLDWLAAKGVVDVTLLGHSRGGSQVALFGAQRQHDLVKHLLLLAPGTWSADKVAASFKKNHGRQLMSVLAEAQALSKSGKGGAYMKGIGILYCPSADVTADSFRSYYEAGPQRGTVSLLSKIKLPVLVVAGGADTVVPDIGEKVASLVDGEKIRLVTVEGAGHFFLDLYGEDVIDALEEFVGN